MLGKRVGTDAPIGVAAGSDAQVPEMIPPGHRVTEDGSCVPAP